MGHIELAAPVSHIWYFKGIPSRMGLILDLSPRVLEKVLYFASYIVLDPGESNLEYKQVLSERNSRMQEKPGETSSVREWALSPLKNCWKPLTWKRIRRTENRAEGVHRPEARQNH